MDTEWETPQPLLTDGTCKLFGLALKAATRSDPTKNFFTLIFIATVSEGNGKRIKQYLILEPPVLLETLSSMKKWQLPTDKWNWVQKQQTKAV